MSQPKYGTKVIGAGHLVKEVLDELEIAKIIDEALDYQPEIDATYGELSQAVIINRMSFKPKPLYEMSRWAGESGIAEILGIEASWLDDDRLGAMLDGLSKKQVDIWSKIVEIAVKKYELAPDVLNADTTSIYFEGKYENEDGTPKAEPDAPLLVEGYNKDGKRKKAQYVLSLITSGRIPLYYGAWDGNQSDDGVYLADLQTLQKSDLSLENVVLVGDRKLCNKEAMLGFCRTNQYFLAPFPWRESAKKAWLATWELLQREEMEWVEVDYVSRNQEQKPIHERSQYKACEISYILTDKEKETSYELRWVFSLSSDKAAKDKSKREKSVQNGEQVLQHIQSLLGKYDYKNRQTITKRIESRLKKCGATRFFDYVLSGNEARQNWKLRWTIRKSALVESQKFDGIALFCTSVPLEKYSTTEVVTTYKKQINVEQSIDFIKSPIQIRPMWLKLPRRIAGLTLLIMIAVLIAALIEHKVRLHIAQTGELVHGLMPENRDNPLPTATKILEAFHDYAFVTIQHDDARIDIHYPELRPVQQQLWDIIFPPYTTASNPHGG